ncbi:MAG: glucose 1-dehydrogenase, partial [Okeania sp. SIO3B3]|nr:glucose 1-dehydrogenase [Okeania sp. SIO3B3]
GKNVLVTGGTSGIGQAIAVRFAREGANVAINYRKQIEDAAQTEEMVDICIKQMHDHGVKTALVKGDVSKEDDVQAMVQQTITELGGLDILINNAGIQIPADSHELEASNFDRVISVNLRGAFLCAREAIRHFLAEDKKGCIINVSSVHQIIPKPRFLTYSMSKGGMQNLTRTLALEYAGRKIRVNGIGPGATITPINRAWVDDEEKAQQVLQHIPMGRAGEADEMGAVATFLASTEADYITGQTLYVDGGLTLYPDFRTAWSSE